MIEEIVNTTEIAETIGFTSNETNWYIRIGKVILSVCTRKAVTVYSSIDTKNDNNPPESNAGIRSGSITLKRILSLDPPKTTAASSIETSNFFKLAIKILKIYGITIIECANIKTSIEDTYPIHTEKIKKETPIVTAGIIKGPKNKLIRVFLKNKFPLTIPTAPKKLTISAIKVEKHAIFKLNRIEFQILGSLKNEI
jgi:hypothetical protein